VHREGRVEVDCRIEPGRLAIGADFYIEYVAPRCALVMVWYL
jgi:hypothetical protein